ncbi:MAG TPA: GAF domain-containing protein [Candidatus Limnocylindria bacterium]|nr:GAF domain-containing protein [Candidatus Limnocylindria bacterium]
MHRFIRGFLVPFLLLAIPLGILAGLGFVAAHRQLERTRDAAVARTVDAVTALVADYQESLRREAVILAQDPAVIEGTAKGDWAILARGASPRVLALTRDGLADFVTIRDARGAPLVQVPASPPPSLPGTPAVSEPILTLRLAGGQPYFLVTAPVQSPTGRETPDGPGAVVAGRRVEGLSALLDRLPARPAVVFVAGDRALAASRSDLPGSGWSRAAAVGATEVEAEPFAVRRLAAPVVTSPDGGLWAVLSVREFAQAERRLLLEFFALLGAGAVVLAGVVLAFLPAGGRPRPEPGGSGPRPDSPRVVLERRNRELEALNAVFATMSRGSDLVTTAGETLEVVRGLARMDVGVIYRLDPDGGQLILEGQSGIDPRYLDRSRNRPVEGSRVGDAARTGQILVTRLDASPPSEDSIREMAAERAHRTQLAVPIPVENRTWGVMALVSKEVREFSAEELTILSGVAQQVGLAVERAQLRDKAAVRLNQLAAQRVIERHISEHLDTEELLVVIARSAQRLVGGTFAALYLLEGDTLHPRAWSDVPDWIRDFRFKLGAGVAGAALATGRGMLANDYPSSPGAMAEFIPFTSRLLAAPLMAGDRPLGVMTAGRGSGAPPFTEEDLSTLTDFATQAAVALEHARLFDEATRNAAQYQALLEVSGAVSSTLDVDRVLDLVVDRCRTLLGVAAVGVMRVDRDTGVVAYERGRGLSGEFIASLRMRLGEGTTGRAIAERVPVWSEDILNDPALAINPDARELIEREGYRAVLSVPLLTKGDAHGAVAAYWWEPHTPSAEEISIMTAFAGQAATALDNARLFAQERDRKASLSSLLEINKKIGALATPESLLTSIAEEAARLLDIDNAGFRLLDGDDLVVAGLAGTAGQTMIRPRIKVGESLTGRVFASGQVLMCEIETGGVVADHLVADQRLGYTHYLGVPLMVGERAIGVLTYRGRRPFTAREQELAETFAGQAAIAIDHSRLYREASEQAERMRVVAEMGRVLVSTLDEARVLEIVTTQVHESLGKLDIAIWLQEGAGGPLRLVAGQGPFSGPLAERAQPLNLDEGVVGRALTDRAPVWTPDVLNDPRIELRPASRRWIEAIGGRSILAVPLIREHLLGALVVYRPVGRSFSSREVEYLTAFANQIAVAIENARLYQALDVRAARLRRLARLAHIVSSSLDMDEVLRAITEAAGELIAGPVASIWVANETARTLEFRAGSDPMVDDSPSRTVPYGEGGVGWVAVHRQTLEVADIARDARFKATESAASQGLRSVLAVPIVFQDALLGVLSLSGRGPIELGPDDGQLLESFVAQAGVAIRNAGLYGETRGRLEESRALLEVAEILNSTLDSKRLLREVTMKIAQVCRVDRCSIQRWVDGRVVPLMSQFADGHQDPDAWARYRRLAASLPERPRLHARTVETRRPVIVPDTSLSDLVPAEWMEVFQLKSTMTVPLIRQDEVIGVMGLDHTERATPFEPWQVDLAMAIAGQLALSLANTQLYTQVQERLRETTALLAVGRALSQPEPTVHVMRTVAREVAHAFGADMAAVYSLDAKHEALVPTAGYHVPKHLLEPFLTRPFTLANFPALTQVWREGRAAWSSDAKADPRFDPAVLEGIDAHSVLFAPTTVRGEPVGALFLVWWQTGREFGESELRLLEGVAAQVGLGMENAELGRQTEVKLQETETLLSVSQTLASTLDVDVLTRQFLRHVARGLGADSAAMWRLEDDGEWMTPLAGYHLPAERIEALRDVRLSLRQHAFYREAAERRRSVISTDAAHDPRIPEEFRRSVPLRTHLFVPIFAQEQMIGGFSADWWDKAHELSEAERRMMEAVASQAGVALQNARLFQDNQRRVQELSVLHELSRSVTGQLDQAGILDSLHQQVPRVLDVRHMSAVLLDEGGDRLNVVLRVRDGRRCDEEEPHSYSLDQAGLTTIVLNTGRPIRSADYLAECRRYGVAPVANAVDMPHVLIVPMTAGDRAIGLLILRSPDRAFTEADERLLVNIAQLVALMLRSARLYEERTRALGELGAAQDQLVRTEKLRALGEMASGVAHDFNNLLASILGRAQLLLERVEDVKLRQWLKVIERAALDGARTVRRLQDFTGIRRDQPAVEVDLNQVVQQVLETTESIWRQARRGSGVEIEVVTDLAAGLPPVAGDPAELREAFTNLVLNAVDAMPGAGTLTLRTRTSEGQVEVEVCDTGTGIPEHVREKIFDPFFTTKGPKGTGLGLSMAYGILQRHNGRITVESREGHGTVFRLLFPVAVSGSVEEAAPPLAAAGGSPVSLHCLVVDDEDEVGQVVADILTTAGHTAVTVRSGQEAVGRLGDEGFDAVFTDLAMPGMTGWQVARAVKDRAPEVPVVLMSGFGVEVAPEDLPARGVDLVLAKPLQIQDILRALATIRSRTGRP